MNGMKNKVISILLILLLAAAPLTGCGQLAQLAQLDTEAPALPELALVEEAPPQSPEGEGTDAAGDLDYEMPEDPGAGLVLLEEDAPQSQGPEQPSQQSASTATPKVTATPKATATPGPTSTPEAIDRDGTYTSRDDVALYLYTYGHLPDNFITKKEARALGWPGGGLDDYAYGACIGGDHFGNYEGLLPEAPGRTYTECDVDTLHKKSRGAKRIIFSNDGLIYYTGDHYESFTLLYGEE